MSWQENQTFGIFAATWQIFRRSIKADMETVQVVVQASVCLHNFLKLTSSTFNSPLGLNFPMVLLKVPEEEVLKQILVD